MKNSARLDVDAVFHSVTETSLSVGSLSEHLALTPSAAESFTASSGTAAIAISGPTAVSTIVLKNTGKSPLLLTSISIPAGRVAVIPTTATITVAAPSGAGSYSCVWLG